MDLMNFNGNKIISCNFLQRAYDKNEYYILKGNRFCLFYSFQKGVESY